MESLFSVGDSVVCIRSEKDPGMPYECPLVEGKTYTISAIRVCSCGRVRVDVGVNYPESSSCAGCDDDNGTIEWTQYRFVKPETNHQLEEQIHESLKGEKIILKYSSSN